MKPRYLFFTLCALLLAACQAERVRTEFAIAGDKITHHLDHLPGNLTATHRDYAFLLECGGMRVLAPIQQSDGTYFLPVQADVSGASNVTRPPTHYHADIAIKELVCRPNQHNAKRLQLYIVTSSPSKLTPSPVATGCNLGTLELGRYTLEYLNRDHSTVYLGAFDI